VSKTPQILPAGSRAQAAANPEDQERATAPSVRPSYGVWHEQAGSA
jgi:hypothetical protein